MKREVRFAKIFFSVNCIFWVIILAIGITKWQGIDEEALNKQLLPLEGEIINCEEREMSDTYVFLMEGYGEKKFSLFYTNEIPFEKLLDAEKQRIPVEILVLEREFVENVDDIEIEIYALDAGEICRMTLDDYICHEKNNYIIMIILGAILSIGMIFGYLYTWYQFG